MFISKSSNGQHVDVGAVTRKAARRKSIECLGKTYVTKLVVPAIYTDWPGNLGSPH